MTQADADSRKERSSPAGEPLPLIEQIPAAIVLFDADLRCVMINAAWHRAFRAACSEPVGRDFASLFPPSGQFLRLSLMRAVAGETVTCEPASALSSDGPVCRFRPHVAPWRDSRGLIRGAILVCETMPAEPEHALRPREADAADPAGTDKAEGIALFPGGFGETARDTALEGSRARALEANAVLLHAILETMPDALVVIDIDGHILLFSKAAEAMFGYAASEVVGRNVAMLMPEMVREEHDVHMARYRRTSESRMIGRPRRLIGRRKDESQFPHSLQIAEAFAGGQRMIAGFMRDLTVMEASALEVEQLQRELAHIGRVHEMGTLASTIAHELNQPLMAITNIVQTAAELLKLGDPAMREPTVKALNEAGQETLRAGEILRRLRDFLSRGELEKTFENACNLAQDAIAFESSLARYRNIKCKIKCAPGLAPILVDRVQIQQVILNLVKNAVQSIGQDGKVTVAITPAMNMVRFTVSDTGPGVPDGRIARLFAPFSTTKAEGMGLGLPICRSIIEAHGGTIWYEAAPCGGAAFIFTLPLFHEESNDAE